MCFVSDSKDVEQLLQNGITHILSVHDNAKPVLEVRELINSMGHCKAIANCTVLFEVVKNLLFSCLVI